MKYNPKPIVEIATALYVLSRVAGCSPGNPTGNENKPENINPKSNKVLELPRPVEDPDMPIDTTSVDLDSLLQGCPFRPDNMSDKEWKELSLYAMGNINWGKDKPPWIKEQGYGCGRCHYDKDGGNKNINIKEMRDDRKRKRFIRKIPRQQNF